MSLLQEAYEPFIIMNKISQNDGYGGVTTTWEDGASFNGALVFDSSTQAMIAQALGVTSAYTLTTTKDIDLWFHDVIKRESNGEVFRVTSNGKDNKTPNSATLNMRQVNLEVFKL